jgi:hypothetical protein
VAQRVTYLQLLKRTLINFVIVMASIPSGTASDTSDAEDDLEHDLLDAISLQPRL